MHTFGLTFLMPTTWQAVHHDWEAREAGYWEAYFEGHGYASWVAWRDKYIQPLNLAGRTWNLYKIDKPEVTVPNMWAGAFKGWRHYYPEDVRAIQFKDLVKNPEVARNEKVAAVLANFSDPTTIIGFMDGKKMVIFEGMHRASAMALATRDDQKITGDVFIAVTEFGAEEAALFESTYRQKE